MDHICVIWVICGSAMDHIIMGIWVIYWLYMAHIMGHIWVTITRVICGSTMIIWVIGVMYESYGSTMIDRSYMECI